MFSEPLAVLFTQYSRTVKADEWQLLSEGWRNTYVLPLRPTFLPGLVDTSDWPEAQGPSCSWAGACYLQGLCSWHLQGMSFMLKPRLISQVQDRSSWSAFFLPADCKVAAFPPSGLLPPPTWARAGRRHAGPGFQLGCCSPSFSPSFVLSEIKHLDSSKWLIVLFSGEKR